jgi:hypothetical protein
MKAGLVAVEETELGAGGQGGEGVSNAIRFIGFGGFSPKFFP